MANLTGTRAKRGPKAVPVVLMQSSRGKGFVSGGLGHELRGYFGGGGDLLLARARRANRAALRRGAP